MSIFLDIEPVPFRLLDDLMMQMEANNDRLRERLGDKGSTERPAPQRAAHNAEDSTYRRPEPAAHPRGSGIACAWVRTINADVRRIYSTDGTAFADCDLSGGPVTEYPTPTLVDSVIFPGGLEFSRNAGEVQQGVESWLRQVSDRGRSIGLDQIVLPAGGDELIVAYRSRSVARIMVQTLTATTTWYVVNEPDEAGDLFFSYGTGSGGVVVESEHKVGALTRAFHVTRSTVTEIIPPPVVEDMYVEIPGAPAGTVQAAQFVAVQYSNGKLGLNNIATVIFPTFYPVYTSEQIDGLSFTSTNEISLTLSNGLGELTRSGHAVSRTPIFGTPSALSFLEAGGKSDPLPNADYSDIPTTYSQPPYYVSAEWDGFNTIEVYRQAGRPTTQYLAMEQGRPVPSANITVPEVFADESTGNPDYVLAWDYGQKGLTRSRLQALGFVLP